MSLQVRSDAKIAADAIRLWIQSYQERFSCFQNQYVFIEICKALGTLGSIYTLPYLFSQSLLLAAKGYSSLEISHLLKTPQNIKKMAKVKKDLNLELLDSRLKSRALNDPSFKINIERAGEMLPSILKLETAKAEHILQQLDKLTPDELKLLKAEFQKPG